MPMSLSHLPMIPQFRFDSSEQMRNLQIIVVIKALILKISFFFLPVFLFNLGWHQIYDLFAYRYFTQLQSGLITVSLYYLIFRTTIAVLAIPTARLTNKLGLAKVIFYSQMMFLLLFAILMFSDSYWYLVFLAAVINGVHTAFFWIPYHTTLTMYSHKENLGQDMGLITFFLKFAETMAPALSGLAIVLIGYKFVFFVSAGLVLLSTIFVLKLDLKKVKDEVSVSELFDWLKAKTFRKLSITYMGKYVNDAALALWPLYVFLLLGSVDKVGYLYTISMFLSMVLTLFTGFYIDHTKNKKLYFTSAGILSAVWIVKSFITSVWSIALADTVSRFTENFHWLFYDTSIVKRGKGSQALSYFAYREFFLSISGILTWIVIPLIFFISSSWQTLFILAAVGVMLTIFVNEEK